MTADSWARQMANHYYSRGSSFGPLVFYGEASDVSAAMTYAEDRCRMMCPDARILRLSMKDFIRGLVRRVREGNDRHSFAISLCQQDLLMLEDFEEIGGKAVSQQEIYYILDRLYEEGRYLVIGMSVRPKDLASVEDRVRTQLEGGLLCRLGEPEERSDTDGDHDEKREAPAP